MSIVSNSGDKNATIARLLQNPGDMANAIKIYYGADAASKFNTLMTAHLTIAAELVQDSLNGDAVKAADAEKRWQANADDIATALSSLNPSNWSKDALESMLYEHLSVTKQEAVDLITKNYTASVTDYDKIHDQALMMADALSGGIIKQFPNKF